MSWDPPVYMRFADMRTRPAMELLARVSTGDPRTVVDLGCGPGNSTALLRARYGRARIIGVDNSPEMLERARAGALVIVDDTGKLTGVFTDGDLRRLAFSDHSSIDVPVEDVMTRSPRCLTDGSVVRDAVSRWSPEP